MPKGEHDGDRRGPKRPKAQRQMHMLEMVQLLRRGWTNSMLAKRYDVHTSEITHDFKQLCKRFALDTSDVALLRGLKIEELAEVKREAWEAFDRAKGGDVSEEMASKVMEVLARNGVDLTEVLGDKPLRIHVAEKFSPDALKIVLECIKQERELLNINPAKNVKVGLDESAFAAFASVPKVEKGEVEREMIRLLEEECETLPGEPLDDEGAERNGKQHDVDEGGSAG